MCSQYLKAVLLECDYVCGEGEVPNNSSCDGSCVIVDVCEATSPCQNGGTCITTGGGTSYRCSCPLFYTGYDCEGIISKTTCFTYDFRYITIGCIELCWAKL